MKISYNWLKEYLPIDLPAGEVADILTNIGLEVEGSESVHPVRGGLEGVVIGEVLACRKHPNAERLTLTTVNLGGNEPVQIVCGAPNVEKGQKVAVAIVGATLFPGGEGMTIKKASIRGEHSEGMICAEDELGLGNSHEGIMVLDRKAVPGTPAAAYFNIKPDTVFEIDLTPNRIDAASHLGVARDLAAYLNQKEKTVCHRPVLDGFSVDNTDLTIPVEIQENAGCRRYSAVTISGITVAESPGWLQERLRSIGLTPINNVVDITNFVLHESGQPLHAFDADRIRSRKVIVRTLPAETPFVTLDGEERKLLDSDLMICDGEEGMCIAGVFGGIHSGVSEKTQKVFLESACFDPVYIRRTARHHQLNTDASFRFERGSDPNMTVWALKRAALLIREIAGGSISSTIVDEYPEPVEDHRIRASYAHINRLVGNPMDPAEIRSILESLEIVVEKSDEEGLDLRIPPYRVDVHREADVVEEILRIYGFNRVEMPVGLRSTAVHSRGHGKEKVINHISDLLTSNGFYEMKSNSLTRSAYYPGEGESDEAVRLFNPLSRDLSVLRGTLLFGGLEAIAYNMNRKINDLKLYEFGTCYRQQIAEGKSLLERYRESLNMGLFMCGNERKGSWSNAPEPASFYLLKSRVEAVLEQTGIHPDSLACGLLDHPHYAEGRTCRYGTGKKEGKEVVRYGKVSGILLREFDIRQEVFAAEFDMDLVLDIRSREGIVFKPLPKFHMVTRDFSMILDRGVSYESLRSLAFKTEKKLLREVTLFDVYEGEKIPAGKKSYALTFTLLDEEKTLTDKQIDKVMLHIAKAFEKELGAVVRGLS